MKIKLSIVIVNFNTPQLLLELLKSIRGSTGISFGIKIIVVDNASTDNSLEVLKRIKGITLLRSKENIGFSKGNNLAIPYLEGDLVWFLNPDTVLEPPTIAYMVGFMYSRNDVGIATPKLVLPDGSLDKNCHRAFPTPWNSFCHFSGFGKLFPKSKFFSGYYLGHIPESVETEVDVVGGSSLLIKRKVGELVGWWDERYFMYGEDIVFPLEVKKHGYKVVYVPKVKIMHYHGASSGIKKSSANVTSATTETKIRSAKASTQAMKIFYKDFYKKRYPLFVTLLILAAISFLGYVRVLKFKLFG